MYKPGTQLQASAGHCSVIRAKMCKNGEIAKSFFWPGELIIPDYKQKYCDCIFVVCCLPTFSFPQTSALLHFKWLLSPTI